MSKQCPNTTRQRMCCKKLGTSHDVKGFAIGSFQGCIVVDRENLTSVKDTLKMRSIFGEICPENSRNITCFLAIVLWQSLPGKYPRNWPIFPKICPSKPFEI